MVKNNRNKERGLVKDFDFGDNSTYEFDLGRVNCIYANYTETKNSFKL